MSTLFLKSSSLEHPPLLEASQQVTTPPTVPACSHFSALPSSLWVSPHLPSELFLPKSPFSSPPALKIPLAPRSLCFTHPRCFPQAGEGSVQPGTLFRAGPVSLHRVFDFQVVHLQEGIEREVPWNPLQKREMGGRERFSEEGRLPSPHPRESFQRLSLRVALQKYLGTE